MSVLLLIVGALVTMLGVAMVGYGIPINEFSFGNTLISAGTTAAIGGLVLIAIGTAVGRLQRIADALASDAPVRIRPSETAEHEPPLPAEVPPPAHEPFDAFPPPAPALRNPDLPLPGDYEIAAEDDVPLLPREPKLGPPPFELSKPAPSAKVTPLAEKRADPFDTVRRFPPPPPPPAPERKSFGGRFESMWPEPKAAKRAVEDEPKPVPPPMPAASEPPAAILKSGVVDGMAYTLYVDGSIEAELPQGTLRFASINELRAHLANNP